jgi:uncharacterized RDD family membrane protein YckC
MFCSKCGAEVADGAAFCTNCGQPTQPAAGGPSSSPSPPPVATVPSPANTPSVQSGWQSAAQTPVAYAGFWLRVVAYIIDAILLGIAGAIVFFPLFRIHMHTLVSESPWELYTSPSRPIRALNLLGLMMSWIYYALLESSVWQATIGKKLLGLKVTDLAGNRISFARASGRFFGKILSGMILGIGFLMAGFTRRKQALHDILAGCLVLRQL